MSFNRMFLAWVKNENVGPLYFVLSGELLKCKFKRIETIGMLQKNNDLHTMRICALNASNLLDCFMLYFLLLLFLAGGLSTRQSKCLSSVYVPVVHCLKHDNSAMRVFVMI